MALVFPRAMTVFPKVLANLILWWCNNLKHGDAVTEGIALVFPRVMTVLPKVLANVPMVV